MEHMMPEPPTNGTNGPEAGRATARRAPAAPYVPYRMFKDFLERLSNDGVPEQIELNNIGTPTLNSANHLIASLRFLRLADADGQPTELMLRLVDTVGTESWPAMLELTIRNAYSAMFQIDLSSALPPEFVAAFDRTHGGSAGVRRKSRTFFLHAAIDAGILLNPAIVRTTKPRGIRRSSPPMVRQQSARRQQEAAPRQPERQRDASPLRPKRPISPRPDMRDDRRSGLVRPSGPALAEQLLARVDTRQLRPSEQRAFWVVLKLLKDRGL